MVSYLMSLCPPQPQKKYPYLKKKRESKKHPLKKTSNNDLLNFTYFYHSFSSKVFQDAYFSRMDRKIHYWEWNGMESSFHSYGNGMRPFHSYRNKHSIPIGMENHSLPILKIYASGTQVLNSKKMSKLCIRQFISRFQHFKFSTYWY